jgi:vacuole morphology and inheritance protein 14
MWQLSTDSEQSNRNGSELVDRLLKDIVSEVASTYVPLFAGPNNPNLPQNNPTLPQKAVDPTTKMANLAITDAEGTTPADGEVDTEREGKKAFSLARFIPLLSERIYVISPYARMHLISWLIVLDSVPDLELVAWLPEFLDGIL